TPPLALPDLSGRVHRLEDYRGQVVLVNFWATWCPPCRAEMPSMQRLQDKLAGRPFAILAVDMGETEAEVRDFLKEVPVRFPILLDKDGAALRAWKVRAFPTSFVVDTEGRVRYSLFGAKEWDDPDALEKIGVLLQGAAKRQAGREAAR
ncbi:TlpA disulfide reductase family protein, partial [Pelomicrobium sp.]|uniref:TlpA disulfide reductase family protein n=1 Tax=Pelomicrobium sp. TaxID=2815319 RepID=UPI002FDE4FB3